MLNLNLNYIDPFNKRNRNFLRGKIDFTWSRTTTTAAGALAPIIYGTGSIAYVPFGPETVYFSSSFQTGSLGSGNLSSGSAIGQPVNISITGSGVWPVTGSNTLSIVIGSSLGFNQSEILTFSAADGNMNLSGSKISSSFLPESNNEYNIDFGITHTKGNIYNPLVNWIVQNISSVSDTVAINGYTSSFQIVKNENEELAYVNEVTSSKSASFDYLYNFGVTSSLEANVNNVTGSTTMSFFTNNGVLPVTAKFFNPTTTIAYATASFVATTDDMYVLSASVEYNKGNEANSDINWLTFATSDTQDIEGDASNINGVSASFQLKKDIAVMAGVSEITSSVTGTYPNDYSFNQTASLTSNVNNTTGSVTMSISIPEAGINVERKFFNPTTTTATLTASFAAQKNIADYNVTASVINNKGNVANSDISWVVTGSNEFPQIEASSSLRIVKDGSVQKALTDNIVTNETGSSFKNEYAFNITASLSSSYIPKYSIDSSSFYFGKSIFKVPTLGLDLYSFGTSSILFASFSAQTNVDEYQISASFEPKTTELIEYVLIGGGGAGGRILGEQAGSGGGAGAVVTGSAKLIKDVEYQVNVGNGATPDLDSPGTPILPGSSSFYGPLVPYDGTWTENQNDNGYYIIAPGGGMGVAWPKTPESDPIMNGGSGAGGTAKGALSNFPAAFEYGAAGATVSASAIFNTTTAINLPFDACGKSGSAGFYIPFASVPGRFTAVQGTGGGKPTYISWLNPLINSGSGQVGGGGAGGTAGTSYFGSGSYGGGSTNRGLQQTAAQQVNGTHWTGGGGGGGSTLVEGANGGGYGGSGSMSIRYFSTEVKAIGGLITSGSESGSNYILHTFTSSGNFTYIG